MPRSCLCLANAQMEQKLQYARWKAADGAKALREGREPVSGPRKLLHTVQRTNLIP